jgi:hypothetical protein
MTFYRVNGCLYGIEENPKKKGRKRVTHRCGPKCKAKIRAQVRQHAKDAVRETISGAGAMIVGIILIGALSHSSVV